jgi:hypothetical protein
MDAVDRDRFRALATLRMYEALMTQLSANAEYARLLRVAAGTDITQWERLDYPGREYVLAQGRMALVRAAKVSRKTWNALPPRSRARSDILLKGAAALRIDTDWHGWADPDSS